MSTEHDKRMQDIRELHHALMIKGSHPPGLELIEGEYLQDVGYLLSLFDAPISIVQFNDDMTPERREEIKRLAEAMQHGSITNLPQPEMQQVAWLSPKAGDIVPIYYEAGNRVAYLEAESVGKFLVANRPDVNFVVMPDKIVRLGNECAPAQSWGDATKEFIAMCGVIGPKQAMTATQADPDEDDEDDGTDTPEFETDVQSAPFVPEICTCPKDHNLMHGHLESCPLARG